MARATMTDLIARLRRLLGEPASADPDCPSAWSDNDLQTALDQHRVEVRYLPMAPEETVSPGGAISYLDFHSVPYRNWESSPVLTDATGTVLTASASELETGHFTFATSQLLGVRITGKSYDLYGAAADVLEMHAASVAGRYDFKSGDQSFSRSQHHKHLLGLVEAYRRKQRPRTVTMVRHDVSHRHDSLGETWAGNVL